MIKKSIKKQVNQKGQEVFSKDKTWLKELEGDHEMSEIEYSKSTNESPYRSKTAITAYGTVITGIVMAATGFAVPPDAAQLIATGLIGLFLRVSKK